MLLFSSLYILAMIDIIYIHLFLVVHTVISFSKVAAHLSKMIHNTQTNKASSILKNFLCLQVICHLLQEHHNFTSICRCLRLFGVFLQFWLLHQFLLSTGTGYKIIHLFPFNELNKYLTRKQMWELQWHNNSFLQCLLCVIQPHNITKFNTTLLNNCVLNCNFASKVIKTELYFID